MSTLADIATPLRDWLDDATAREASLLSFGYQGSVYLFKYRGQQWVVKRAGQGWFTGWVHRLMLRREAAVYQKLAGIAGVPASLGMLDDEWLILEFIDGEAWKQARHHLQNPDRFFRSMHQVISNIHAAGVVHGDLKRKGNILVTQDEQPIVLDFGTALRRDGSFLDQVLFKVVARSDFNAWIKMKYAGDYSRISEEDAQWYRPSVFESILRVLRRFWWVISFRRARKRRRARLNQ